MTKKTFSIIVAILIAIAIIVFRDELTFESLISTLGGVGTLLIAVWQWLNKEEVKQDFKRETGVRYNTFKRGQKIR